jgi:CHAT domain-containing protein
LAPALEDRSAFELIIVPDGMLGHLPFGCLLEEGSGTRMSYRRLPYLARRYLIRYEYAAGMLAQPVSSRGKAREYYAGFAPLYRGNALRSRVRSLSRYYEDTLSNLPLLENSVTEIRDGATLTGGDAYLGEDATEARFLAEAPSYRILHLAGHAFSHDRDPQYSGLVFTLPPVDSTHSDQTMYDSLLVDVMRTMAQDGYLHAFELQAMELNADLAVLSACNTGYGKVVAGEGIMSLARAFRYAGCPNLLTSLWQADDLSTRQLMGNYFRHLTAGTGKAEALRKARLDYLEREAEEARTHPYYWANFILIGDNAPVEPPARWPWWLFALLGVGVAGGFWWRKGRTPND